MKYFASIAIFLIIGACPAMADLPAGWSTNFAAALTQAGTQQQPVLVYFTASWCGPCKLMTGTTLTNETVTQTLKNFSHVAVDIDEQHDLAEKYGIRAVPTFQMLTAGGDEVSTTTGYQDAARFLQWLTNGVGEVKESVARQERFKETLSTVANLIQKGDAESLRNSASELINLVAEGDGSMQKMVIEQLTALARRDPTLVLDGLNHPRLAARIRVANLLRVQLGESFEVDPWSDTATRQKSIGQWREKLAASK